MGCCVVLTPSPIEGSAKRRIVILGSTGSIGANCLDVISRFEDRLQPVGLSAHKQWQTLFEQALRFRPRWVTLTDPDAIREASADCLEGVCQLLTGDEGIAKMVTDPEVDLVVTAIVGAAGLTGTWLALEAGKTVAVANKETLVMAGPLVMDLAARRGAQVIPVDSEHSAIFQALRSGRSSEVARVVLTASGGPFRGRSAAGLEDVTIADALKHPTWRMGPKITVDSATLMNKALEIIEARWLFDLPPSQIDVVIHPQSIVHSLVEFIDGSVVGQLSPPDMKLPIQYALTWPQRRPSPAKKLDLTKTLRLDFEPPDEDRFPALRLGREVAAAGGTAGAVLNAANEAAVSSFLAGEMPFTEIVPACRAVLDSHSFSADPTLGELLKLDAWARQEIQRWILA